MRFQRSVEEIAVERADEQSARARAEFHPLKQASGALARRASARSARPSRANRITNPNTRRMREAAERKAAIFRLFEAGAGTSEAAREMGMSLSFARMLRTEFNKRREGTRGAA